MSATSPHTPAEPVGTDPDPRWRLRHLPVLLLVAAVVAAATTIFFGLRDGGVAAFGAAMGVAIATVSFLIASLVIAWADSVNPRLVLPAGMGAYIAKFSVLGGLLFVVAASEWAGLVPLAWGIAVGTVAWTAAQVWWVVRVYGKRDAR